MTLPKILLNIVKVINEKLEIAPEKDTVITISLWDFRDENGDSIPKMDLKQGLRKLEEDNKILKLGNTQHLDRLGRRAEDEIEIEINRGGFQKFYEEHLQETKPPIGKVEFLDNESALKLGDRKCALPPYKNEHFFCRAAFEHQINEPIDWSIIYEKMTGYYEDHFGKSKDTRENWHKVYDTMVAINKRVKEALGIEKLFIWQEKTVKRTR